MNRRHPNRQHNRTSQYRQHTRRPHRRRRNSTRRNGRPRSRTRPPSKHTRLRNGIIYNKRPGHQTRRFSMQLKTMLNSVTNRKIQPHTRSKRTIRSSSNQHPMLLTSVRNQLEPRTYRQSSNRRKYSRRHDTSSSGYNDHSRTQHPVTPTMRRHVSSTRHRGTNHRNNQTLLNNNLRQRRPRRRRRRRTPSTIP